MDLNVEGQNLSIAYRSPKVAASPNSGSWQDLPTWSHSLDKGLARNYKIGS
jgi:hypothetical protein